MNSNQRNFNIYVLLSAFARNLIEVFIPLILFKYGYSLKEVIFYFFLANFFCLIFTRPCIEVSRKYDNKLLAYLGIMFFIGLQIMLQNMVYSTNYLVALAFIFSIYRRCYWVSRRFYNLKVMTKDKNVSSTYSIISIVNQLGVIFSAYIGSLLLDFISINALTIISIIIFLISTIFLKLLKFEHEKNDIPLNFRKTIKQIPFSNLYLMASYELLNTLKFLITFYIFIYVKDNYQTIGILSVITNIATLLFAYFYGKKINGNKNYLRFGIILVCLTYFLKVNIAPMLLFIVSFLEGLFTKMLEISISKEFYTLSKKFEYNNYNLVYENVLNLFRTIILFICLFMNDLKIMIYITLLFMLLGICFDFKHTKKNYFKESSNE